MTTPEPAASYRSSRVSPQDLEKLQHEVRRLHEKVVRLERAGRRCRGARSTGPLPWRARWMPRFIGVLRETGNVSAAIRAVPRSRKMVYEYRKRCVEFAAAWEEAIEKHKAAKPAADGP